MQELKLTTEWQASDVYICDVIEVETEAALFCREHASVA
jgi:hypothetical protein